MGDIPILSVITFLPLAGAVAIFFIRHRSAEIVGGNARYAALFASLFTFVLSVAFSLGSV